MIIPVNLKKLNLPTYTVVSPRKYSAENKDPGTRIMFYPTPESATNILNWGWDNGIDIVKKPYGLLHVTAIATARTLDIPVMRFEKPILITPPEIRLRIIRDHRSRRSLWAAFNNETLTSIIVGLHKAANVVPQVVPHMTLSYRINNDFNIGRNNNTLPFSIGIQSMTVSAYSVRNGE